MTEHEEVKSNAPHSFHFYPTPIRNGYIRQNMEYPAKRIIINSRDTNPFNNATFFIILQIMILIYIPLSSFLAPYYEENIQQQQLPQNQSRDEFNLLKSKIFDIDDYCSFPSLMNGIN